MFVDLNTVDYDANAELTQLFCQTVQNKMHWAAHGHTAAEVVRARDDTTKPNMGVTSWKNAPAGPLRKGDVTVAKNYLSREEIDALNLIVSAYLDFAKLQAHSHKPMHMADWIAKLDDFLRLSDRDILNHADRISHQDAEQHAVAQYERFDHASRQVAEGTDSNFDQAVKRLTEEPPPRIPRRRTKKRDDTSGSDE